MSDQRQNTEVSKDVGSTKQAIVEKVIPVSPYLNVKRELSEEELNSAAVQKLLLNDHDKLELRVEALEEYVEKYYSADKQRCILEEKLKTANSFEILYSSCLAVGSALAGISGIYWDEKGFIFLIIGFVLIFGGIISKTIRK